MQQMRQHQPRRSRPHDTDLRSHGSSGIDRDNGRGRRAVQGTEPGILGPFGACGNPGTACGRPLSPSPARPMLGTIKKNAFLIWGVFMRLPLLAGLSLFALATLPIAAAPAQTAALRGQVSSTEEGAMEGV